MSTQPLAEVDVLKVGTRVRILVDVVLHDRRYLDRVGEITGHIPWDDGTVAGYHVSVFAGMSPAAVTVYQVEEVA